jgi:hypothetical protein
MRRRARIFLGATLLATTLALSIPGVEVVVAAGCDANAQSCGAGARTPAPGAAAAPSCPANGANEAALAGHDAALARLRQELAAQAAVGAPLVPLNGRGYNHGPATGEPGDAVLRFEAHPALPPR